MNKTPILRISPWLTSSSLRLHTGDLLDKLEKPRKCMTLNLTCELWPAVLSLGVSEEDGLIS